MHEKKLKVKGILFDLDGTILDSKDAYVEAARTAFEALGQAPPENFMALEVSFTFPYLKCENETI